MGKPISSTLQAWRSTDLWQKIKIRWTKQLLMVAHHSQILSFLFLDQVNNKSLLKHKAETQMQFAKFKTPEKGTFL